MAIQLSVGVRNARLDSFETTAGASAILRIRTGAPPANCAATRTGTILAAATLPSDWMAAASGGSKALSGTWQDASADNSGAAGHFEIMDSAGTTCHMQGTVSENSGGGDMELQQATTDIVAGQQVTISTFTITDANA